MLLMGLKAVCPKRSTSRPAPGHRFTSICCGIWAITKPDQVWVSDITYIPRQHGFLFLTADMDLYSRNGTCRAAASGLKHLSWVVCF